MAVVNISNAPQQISMTDFDAVVNQFGGPAKGCRFAVRINPVGSLLKQISGGFERELIYLCEAAEYPGRGFFNMEQTYYGPKFKVPHQADYEDITLTFICRNGSIERLYFDNWQGIINPINSFNFNYKNDYRATIDIFAIDDGGMPQYNFTLIDAFPVLVNAQQLTWADDQFLRLGVTFTYTWWTRPGIDPKPQESAPGAVFLAQR